VKVLIIRSAPSPFSLLSLNTHSLSGHTYSVIFLKLVLLYLIRHIDVTTAD
jgi:hypothetical protein